MRSAQLKVEGWQLKLRVAVPVTVPVAVAMLLVVASTRATAQTMDANAVLASIDQKAATYRDVAMKIWSWAEVGYQEAKSSALLQEQLESAGFTVATGVAEIPTAFTATWGSGKPVIGITGKFRFRGVSAHAAAAPERGRSALVGVEAMDAMVNKLREHVDSDDRIHYVITNGGQAPNVVPDFAEVYYYARHNDMRVLDDIWERITNTATGAALGTGTTMEVEMTGAVWNVLPNSYLAGLMQQNLRKVGGYEYTAAERLFAEGIRKSLTGELPPIDSANAVCAPEAGLRSASTDLGDVSWRVPTVQMTAATSLPGTPAHSWQAVAAGGMSIGVKGIMVAAKGMTLMAIDLFSDPAHLAKARAEFEKWRGSNFEYTTRLADRKPALDYRK